MAEGFKEVSVKPSSSRELDPLIETQDVSPPPKCDHREAESSSEEEDQDESYAFDFSLIPYFVTAVKQTIAKEEEPSHPLQKIRKYFPNLKKVLLFPLGMRSGN